MRNGRYTSDIYSKLEILETLFEQLEMRGLSKHQDLFKREMNLRDFHSLNMLVQRRAGLAQAKASK